MKKHTSQSVQQLSGSFFTQQADYVLQGFEHVVKGGRIVEPFAGAGDLTRWCVQHGALSVDQFDIDPKHPEVTKNDSILRPILDQPIVVTNPPWLAKNRNKNKRPYDLWGQDDLYKCHLSSLAHSEVEKGILILPANFLSEARSKAREVFFSRFHINRVRYFRTPVFSDASVAVCAFDFELNRQNWWDHPSEMEVDIDIITASEVKTTKHTFHKRYNWLVGKDFFDFIYEDKDPVKISILKKGQTPNTSIVISLLTDGKLPMGAHIVGEPIFNDKAFTTYTVVTSVPVKNEEAVVSRYNELLQNFVDQYDGMFLANYIEAHQKIKSRKYAALLLSRCIKECQ